MNNNKKLKHWTDFLSNYKILSLVEIKEEVKRKIDEDNLLFKIHPDILEPWILEKKLPLLVLSIMWNYQDRGFIELVIYNLLFGKLWINLDVSYIQTLFTRSIQTCNYTLFKMLITKWVIINNETLVTSFYKIRIDWNEERKFEERKKIIYDLLNCRADLDDKVLLQAIEFWDINIFKKLFKIIQLRDLCEDEHFLQNLIYNKKYNIPQEFFNYITRRIVGIKVAKIMSSKKK